MREFDQPVIELMIFLFSFIQDLGKSFGVMMLFRFPFKKYYKVAIVIALINCTNDFLWIDVIGFYYGVGMSISMYLLIFLCYKFYHVRFSYAVLLGITHSLLQSADERLFSAVTRSLGIFDDFIYDYRAMFVIMTWTGISLTLFFGILYRKRIGFVFMHEGLILSKSMDRIILSLSLLFVSIYQVRSLTLPTSLFIAFFEPLFAIVVLYSIQVKIKKDWNQYYKKRRGLGL